MPYDRSLYISRVKKTLRPNELGQLAFEKFSSIQQSLMESEKKLMNILTLTPQAAFKSINAPRRENRSSPLHKSRTQLENSHKRFRVLPSTVSCYDFAQRIRSKAISLVKKAEFSGLETSLCTAACLTVNLTEYSTSPRRSSHQSL